MATRRPMQKHTTLLKRIDLGFDVIHVRVVAAVTMREEAGCDPDEQTPDGCYVDTDKVVYLLDTLSQKNARKTLLHELGHAMWDLYNEHE